MKKKTRKKRRDYPRIVFYGLLLLFFIYGLFFELNWVKTRTVTVSTPANFVIVHISDIHYRGNRSKLKSIINRINKIKPDVVCFTGDLIEKDGSLDELLALLQELKSPLIGVPGNHDYWQKLDFEKVKNAFKATGGDWLMNQSININDLEFFGSTSISSSKPLLKGKRKILLCHYPAIADSAGSKFDLILAGHTHGGQVRIPFAGALIVPYQSGNYSKGLYETPYGPLHVSPGIGWWFIPVRFCCRPEITVLHI